MLRSYRASRSVEERDSRYPMSGGMHLPHVGDVVVTLDGANVGRVAAVRQEMFLVNIPNGSVWLSLNLVYTRSGGSQGTITMICDGSGLKRYMKGDA